MSRALFSVAVALVMLQALVVGPGCKGACSIADECSSRVGDSVAHATSEDGKMCNNWGTTGTFFFADGTVGTTVSWSTSDEICTCVGDNGTLSRCSGEVVDHSRIICAWEEATCVPPSCPPSSGFSAQCSEESRTDCRDRANFSGNLARPHSNDTSHLYYRNLRIVADVTTCDALRAGQSGGQQELICPAICNAQ